MRELNNGNSRILVTGGSGFIGTNLVNELSRGHEVCDLLHHEGSRFIQWLIFRLCSWRCWSYRQMERIFDDNDDFDYVYHLAAEYGRWNGEALWKPLQTNVMGLKNMIRLRKIRFPYDKFSSAEVYGDYDGIMTEDVMTNNQYRYLPNEWLCNQ